MDETKDCVLIKHVAAVHINNVLTLNQRKIANILLKNAYAYLNKGPWHTISVRDLLNQLGWKESSKSTEMLKIDLKTLNTVQLEWNILNADKKHVWGVTTFLADAKIENGIIRYSYSLALQEMLYNPNIYTKLNLYVQRLFKTKYALILWEFIWCELSKNKNIDEIFQDVSVDDLKKIFGIENKKSYETFKRINQKILGPALEEINTKSDIRIDIELCRNGKKVDKIRFTIKKVKERKPEIFDDNMSILSRILGISHEQVQNDILVYGKDRVDSALSYTTKQIDDGKDIHNVGAFYKGAVKGNWTQKTTSNMVRQTQLDLKIEGIQGPNEFLAFMKILQNDLGDDVFVSWFVDFKLESSSDDILIFKTESSFKRDYILSHFEHQIKKAVLQCFGNKEFKVIS